MKKKNIVKLNGVPENCDFYKSTFINNSVSEHFYCWIIKDNQLRPSQTFHMVQAWVGIPVPKYIPTGMHGVLLLKQRESFLGFPFTVPKSGNFFFTFPFPSVTAGKFFEISCYFPTFKELYKWFLIMPEFFDWKKFAEGLLITSVLGK